MKIAVFWDSSDRYMSSKEHVYEFCCILMVNKLIFSVDQVKYTANEGER
jgi:hypothetical protein